MRVPMLCDCLLRACLAVALGAHVRVQAQMQHPTTATPPLTGKISSSAAFPSGSSSELGIRIAALLAQPEVSRAHWGIAVTSMDGEPLFGVNEAQYFRPASNAKLYTSVAATQMLGLDRRFTTQVVGRGEIRRGVLQGDLILRGGGDANFASGYVLPYTPKAQRAPDAKPRSLADFDDLAAQIAAKGIREVTGDVVGDDTRFEYAPYPAGWAIEDMLWGYGAPVSALTVHDNQLDLTITPAPAGSKASPTIAFDPAVPFYTVNATPLDGHPSAVQTETVYDHKRNLIFEDREPNARDFHISGWMDAKYGAYKDELAIDRPAEFAAAALLQALAQHGITVKGGFRAQHWTAQFLESESAAAHELPRDVAMADAMHRSPGASFDSRVDSVCQAQQAYDPAHPPQPEQVLAEKQSVDFATDLKLTMKESQNLHAEIMLRNMGVNRDCVAGIYAHTALAWERAFLTRVVGLDGADFELLDGSGLSMKDLVTPRATAQLLSFAAKQPWFATWKEALPVGGEDGTLKARFPAAPLKDHVFAKTGTLGESRALSGYVDAASGRTLIFSIMVDTHSPTTAADRKAMDEIVAAIAATQ